MGRGRDNRPVGPQRHRDSRGASTDGDRDECRVANRWVHRAGRTDYRIRGRDWWDTIAVDTGLGWQDAERGWWISGRNQRSPKSNDLRVCQPDQRHSAVRGRHPRPC